MKALITGMNGTVGSALRAHLESNGHTAVGWDRGRVPIDDYAVMENFVRETAPDVFFHLALASQSTGRENESWFVNYEWTSELAWITRMLAVPFVFTSTVMVFSDAARGPFHPDDEPDAPEGYGREKSLAEARVFYQNPEARVVRLGWQIGDAPGGNQMIDFLDREHREKGRIAASTAWLPACSFLPDTAAALSTMGDRSPGIYQIDSNRRWNFFQIASALGAIGDRKWKVEANADFVYDQRMIDERLEVPALSERLPGLGAQ